MTCFMILFNKYFVNKNNNNIEKNGHNRNKIAAMGRNNKRNKFLSLNFTFSKQTGSHIFG